MKKKLKNLLILIIVLAVVALALWFAKDFFLKKSQPTEQPKNEQQEQPVAQANPQSKSVEIKQDVDNYAINVKYPEFSGLSNTKALADANLALKNKIEKDISDFKQDITENSAKELSSKNILSNIYEITMFTNDVVSVRFNTLYYVAGMSNPSNYEEVFNYDFKNNKEIALADLFNPGSNYLAKLSNLSADSLKKQLNSQDYSKDMIASGTGEKESNFSDFVFTKSTLVVVFNPGQVASFAVGIKYVDIPWSSMADINNNSELVKAITK
jgi:hypothetical protein